jgi:kynureninase
MEDIEALIEREGESIALVLLGGVNYYTGQVFDMERITRLAHTKGCIVGFDLAHAVGNIELQLHDWEVDFAVWCSYKYLNGGPGTIAGCFVHDKHADKPDLPRFAGWWGHNKETRFLMGPDFTPIPGAEGWQLSNPPILPLAALRASMEIFDETGIKTLREKSRRLTGYLEFLVDQIGEDKVAIITPRDDNQRGCQLSLVVKRNGREVYQKLTGEGVICDWREPDVIRIAPVLLYNSFMDVFRFAEILRKSI